MRPFISSDEKRGSVWGPILRVVLPYLVLGAAWILFSDRILLSLVNQPDRLIVISTAKGWFYVLITGVLLSILIYGELRRQLSLEAKLRDGLREKSALLFELNHRVKNNLQLMVSLLSLESGNLADGAAKQLNARMLGRVRAMALAHESSVERGGIDRIELGAYVRDLWAALVDVHKGKNRDASFALDELYISSDRASAFGLFAAEAMSEALRRYRDVSPPCAFFLGLSAEKTGRAEFLIRVKSCGSNAPGDRLAEDLMEALALQLRGGLARSYDGERAIDELRLDFPVSEVAHHG
jgi:Signal transduction histidine kinase